MTPVTHPLHPLYPSQDSAFEAIAVDLRKLVIARAYAASTPPRPKCRTESSTTVVGLSHATTTVYIPTPMDNAKGKQPLMCLSDLLLRHTLAPVLSHWSQSGVEVDYGVP